MSVSVCFPRILCFDGLQETSEDIQSYYQNCLQFIQSFPAQFEAPEQQEEPFHAFGQWLHNASHVRRTGDSSKKIIFFEVVLRKNTSIIDYNSDYE